MITFELESNREVTQPDGASLPVWQVLFGGILDVQLLDPATGDPVRPRRRHGQVYIGDPVENYRLRIGAAPNFVFNMVKDAQDRHANTPGLENDGFVSIVEGSLFALNEDGTRGVALDAAEYLTE